MVPASAVAVRHPSALKRYRQSEKRRRRNHAIKTRLRHLVREVRSAIAARDAGAAGAGLGRAERALQKAVTKGVLHPNNAARKVARLAHAVGRISSRATGQEPDPRLRLLQKSGHGGSCCGRCTRGEGRGAPHRRS